MCASQILRLHLVGSQKKTKPNKKMNNTYSTYKNIKLRRTQKRKNVLPYDMLRLIFLLVASLESTSFRIDIVEMLSDLKHPSPFLQRKRKAGFGPASRKTLFKLWIASLLDSDHPW